MWHCQMANTPCLRKVQVIIDLLDRTYISISRENHWSPNNVKERHFSASETLHTCMTKKIYIPILSSFTVYNCIGPKTDASP